jgi:hypothetical protein
MQRSYGGSVISQRVPGGVAHKMPADLRAALIANTSPRPLGRRGLADSRPDQPKD